MTRTQPRQTQTVSTQTCGWTSGVVRSWIEFWFRPVEPVGLQMLRVLAGLLFIGWLLPLFGHLEALFGLEGWFDQQAYREAARLPEEMRPQFGWSILFLCGTHPLLFKATCAGSLVVLILFTLGIATRLTSIASWVVVVSFTANPALGDDADGLLVLLAFYLMIGYVFLNQTLSHRSMATRLFGSREQILLFNRTSPASAFQGRPSVAANVSLRLLQVHLAMAFVASGLHKLQFGDWWAGVALWYPLYPPLSATIQDAQTHMNHGVAMLTILSLGAYAVLSWQIAFPVFAWKPRWRLLLLGGACVSCLGNAWLYKLPLFGAVLFIGCLSYLTPDEWYRIGDRFRTVTGAAARRG